MLRILFFGKKSSDSLTWTSTGNLRNLNVTGITTNTWFRRLLITECGNDTSNVRKVSIVTPYGSNTVFPNSHTVCFPDSSGILTGSLSSAPATSTFTYKWIQSLDNGVTWNPTTFTAVNFPRVPVPDTIWVRRIVLGGCIKDTSNISKIFPILPVVADSIFKNQMVCYDSKPDSLRGSNPKGGTGIYKIYWQSSEDKLLWTHADSVSTVYSPPAVTDTIYYRRIVKSGCSADTSNVIRMIVTPSLLAFKAITVSRKRRRK